MADFSFVLKVLIAFGACQAFFIAAILLLMKNQSLAKKLLALFLVIEGVTLVERLLVETNLILSIPHLVGISYPISFLKPPILLFLAYAIVDKKFKFAGKHSLHLIPFTLMVLMNVPFYFESGSAKVETARAFIVNMPTYDSFEFYFSLSFFVYIGIYIMATIQVLKRFRTHVKNNKTANWYVAILQLYILFLATHLLYFVIYPSGLIDIPQFNIWSMLILTFVIQAVAYGFVRGSDMFNSKNIPNLEDLEKRSKDVQLIKEKLEQDKIYLDDTLDLKSFAKSISLSQNYISELINQNFNCSFKNLVAQYRVKNAKEIMKRELHSKTKLIDIAYDSGFNNKVSFYRAFKLHQGMSPSEYFQELKKSASD